MGLRQLVKDISNNDSEFYTEFWSDATCRRFLEQLCKTAHVSWLQDATRLTPERFFAVFAEYLEELHRHATTADGITRSWFSCFDALKDGGHTVVLNSFGVDSQRVLMRSVPDERLVLQLTVNYKMWGKRDVATWS